MSLELVVETELMLCKGSKSELMAKYANEQQVIMNKYGGHRGDVPVNPDHPDSKEFKRLEMKLQLLGKM